MYTLKSIQIKITITLLIIHLFTSCTTPGEKQVINNNASPAGQYSVYIINNNLHTGILIPVITESMQNICALKHFTDYEYADVGWGEEDVYQSPADTFCMDAKAILLINSSVVRVEGQNGSIDSMVGWSDFAVKFSLSYEQFKRLCGFIDDSFHKDPGSGLVITSHKSSGRIIFFRSVHSYHLFNTCNTWVANALDYSGIKVSGTVVITARGLYNAIKDQGIVLKPLK